MAAPVLQAEGSATGNTTGSLSPTIPIHQADDILLASVVFWGPATVGDVAAIPTPAGWTEIANLATPAVTIDGRIGWFWLRATSGTTTVSFARGASWDTGTDTCFSARIYVIRGCITTGDPWDEADPTVVYNTANQPIDAVTVSGSERMVLQMLTCQDDWLTNPTAPAGWTAGSVQESTSGTDAGHFDFRKDNVSASTTADTPTVPAPTQGYYAYLGISFKPPPPVTDFPLDAQPGSYALSGTAASPLADRAVPADPGSYSLTGPDASVPAGRVVAADPGAYVLSGTDAALVAGRMLAADPGSYVLTGSIADLIYTSAGAFVLDAQPAAYALSGIAASSVAGRIVSADPSSYTLTGFATGLVYTPAGAFALNAESGSYALSGVATSVLAGRLLAAGSGAYLIVGFDATLGIPAAVVAGSVSVAETTGAGVTVADTDGAQASVETLTGVSVSVLDLVP